MGPNSQALTNSGGLAGKNWDGQVMPYIWATQRWYLYGELWFNGVIVQLLPPQFLLVSFAYYHEKIVIGLAHRISIAFAAITTMKSYLPIWWGLKCAHHLKNTTSASLVAWSLIRQGLVVYGDFFIRAHLTLCVGHLLLFRRT